MMFPVRVKLNRLEKEVLAYAQRMEQGISVNEKTVAEMRDLAQHLDMDVVAYLGAEALEAKSGKALWK